MPRPTIDLEPFREAITARWEAYDTSKDIISYLAEHESLTISLRTLDKWLKHWDLVRQQRHQAADLEPFRELITTRWQAHNTDQQIISFLTGHGIDISERTLRRWLQRWNLRRQERTEMNIDVHERIHELYFEQALTDDEILMVMRSEGYSLRTHSALGTDQERRLFYQQEGHSNLPPLHKPFPSSQQSRTNRASSSETTRVLRRSDRYCHSLLRSQLPLYARTATIHQCPERYHVCDLQRLFT